jgi:hypothetical protein
MSHLLTQSALLAGLCLTTNACHHVTPSVPAKAPMTTLNACASALHDLAWGDFSAWHGLSDACTTDDAVAALGHYIGGDRAGNLGGSPTRYRIYPATRVSPHGVYVWDEGDHLVLVRLHDVQDVRPPLDQVGEPEAKDISRLTGFQTQWIYAARGLTLHVDDDTGAITSVYAYSPMALSAFRASWLSRIEIRRIPIQ